MISFKPLTKDGKAELIGEIRSVIPSADLELLSENLDMLSESFDADSCGVTYSNGCLLARIYEDEYYFIYPLSLCYVADPVAAVEEIRAYVVKEEIPLVLSDVPSEDLGGLLTAFRHATVDAVDEGYYTVRIMSEAALLDGMPMVSGDEGIELSPLTAEDDEIYARLCKDEDTNRYWGYNYAEDEPDPADSYFRENAEREFARGVSVCLALRVRGVFAGEATLYSFDLKGGCECAVRLLPAFRHKGYATEALKMLRGLASSLGLLYLCATVYEENKASVRLTQKVLDEQSRLDGIVKFKTKL